MGRESAVRALHPQRIISVSLHGIGFRYHGASLLDHEVRGFGVRVMLVEPSFTNTSILELKTKERRQSGLTSTPPTERLSHVWDREVKSGSTSREVAEVIYRTVTATSPRMRYRVGQAKTLSVLRRFVPSLVFARSALRWFVAPHMFFRFIGLSFLVPGVVSSSLPPAFAIPAAFVDRAAGMLAILAAIGLAIGLAKV
jgi:hypothetical protein